MALSQTPNAQNAADQTPVSTMNMTPLIDVLLVLLIMFVVTIPIATHSVEVDLGGDGIEIPAPNALVNKLTVTQQDALLWNGEAVSEAQLAALLRVTTEMPLEPELQYEPEALASYDTSARVLQIIKASGVTKFGFVGNEKYRLFASGEAAAGD